MTDNEIKKALEEELKTAMIINHRFEESNDTENPDDHKFIALLIDTIKLINRQKAEIERLEKDSKRLKKVQMQLDDAMKMYTTIKAEAIKEFAERLKKSSSYSVVADGDREIPSTRRYSISESNIDNLVKEMVGEG